MIREKGVVTHMSYKLETHLVTKSNARRKFDKTGSIPVPIYQSATFEHEGLGKSSGYDYSRLQNPTKEELEEVLKSIEQGKDALAFSSGMAALATLSELFNSGDHIIVGDDLYGGTIRLFDHILRKRNIRVVSVDTTDLRQIEKKINQYTKAIFIETPTNPLGKISDIQSISHIAEKHKILLIVDNTFLTPYYQNPLLLGADIVLHSGTKYLGGHNDTLAGALIVKDEEVAEKLRFTIKTIGNGIAPFDAFLILRGIKTLGVRLNQASTNTRTIFTFLKTHKKIKKIYYIGDSDNIGYVLNQKQSRGSGAMISFEVDTVQTAHRVLENVQLISFAESLGGVESLITYPITQTHADISKELLEKNGINEKFLRLSVGIEHIDDLIDDLKQALGD